jgi:iron(III) transport system substrate-binding protein
MFFRFGLMLLVCLMACSKNQKTEVWIYTSTYKEVLSKYEPKLSEKFPEVKIRWYQAGSETVASRIQAEKISGKIKADILMTSDLFFFFELLNENQLDTIESLSELKLPPEHVGQDSRFVVSRFPVMVIAYNKKFIPENKAPKSWNDLLKPEYSGKIAMPSPLESGSVLTALFFLKTALGKEAFESLRKQNVLASGGNGSTLSRVLSGEKPIGILLMENVLQAQEKGQDNVAYVVPQEGAFPIPSPIAIFLKPDRPSAERQIVQNVAKWFLTQEAQETLVEGWVYSTFPEFKAPVNAPAWQSLKLAPWNLETFKKWTLDRQALKDEFSKTVLR